MIHEPFVIHEPFAKIYKSKYSLILVPILVFPNANIEILESIDTSTSSYEVWTINWTDIDGDLNPLLEITAQSVQYTFKIIDDKLVTNATFDFESIKSYNITLR